MLRLRASCRAASAAAHADAGGRRRWAKQQQSRLCHVRSELEKTLEAAALEAVKNPLPIDERRVRNAAFREERLKAQAAGGPASGLDELMGTADVAPLSDVASRDSWKPLEDRAAPGDEMPSFMTEGDGLAPLSDGSIFEEASTDADAKPLFLQDEVEPVAAAAEAAAASAPHTSHRRPPASNTPPPVHPAREHPPAGGQGILAQGRHPARGGGGGGAVSGRPATPPATDDSGLADAAQQQQPHTSHRR
eukprot:Rhum_TRINITY_DN14422_c8_g2::Rhum_TRINITY_DN14422_c8_g2_i3::g.88116::m.88116